MKKSIQFRPQFASGREILAETATFLPVESGRRRAGREMFLPEIRHLLGFPAIFNFNPENFTVAQPLLKEACDEMR
jgi:hypothetical protein